MKTTAYYQCMFFCLALAAGAVHAIKISSEPASAVTTEPAFGGVAFREGNAKIDAHTMRHGKIQEIDFKKQIIRIHNTELHFHSNQLKVFSGKHISSITMLAKGRTIRFLLDPTDDKERTISVVYLD